MRLALTVYPFLVLASIAVDSYRRGWHDRAAGTTVLATTTRRSFTKRIGSLTPPSGLRLDPHSDAAADPPPLPDPWRDSPYGRYRKRRMPRR